MLKKSLIVDDLPLDAELTRRVLESFRGEHEVVIVCDGEQALFELNKAHNFDVVLLDLHLPKIDGFEVLKELSSKPFLSAVPIIVLSSSRNPTHRMRTRMLGAWEFVEKAVDYSEFKASLSKTLKHHGL